MKKLRFDWLMLILTVILSSVAMCACVLIKDEMTGDATGGIIWHAMFFALPLTFSLIGICIAEGIRSTKYVIQKKGNRILSFVLAITIGALLGAGGQVVINLVGTSTSEQSPIDKVEQKEEAAYSDISIVLDYSRSMHEEVGDYAYVVDALLGKLEGENTAQIITFASKIFETTELEKCTDSNKAALTSTIEGVYHTGDSVLGEALELACDTLINSGEHDNKKVVLISDGQTDDMISQLEDVFVDNNIALYTLTPSGENHLMADVVEKSGGFDVEYNGQNTSLDELAAALQTKNYKPADNKTSKEGYSENGNVSIAYGTAGLSVWSFFVRLIVLVLYALLATGVMYYSVSLSSVISSVITAVIASLLLLAVGDIIVLAGIIYVPLFHSAFTRYYKIS